jgi:type I restriction enzyme, S subunit
MKALLDSFELAASAPGGIEKLRKLVLELAVRGKLVPQNKNDEPATELLKRIAAEKVGLVKTGKIKALKELAPISEEEKPFELPRGWEWVRLGNIQLFQNGYAFKSSDFTAKGVGVIRITNLVNGGLSEKNMVYVDKSIASTIPEQFWVNPGDLLIAMSGATTGKLGFHNLSERYLLNQRVGRIEILLANSDYCHRYLTTKIQQNLAISMGSAIPNISTEQINGLLIPLPPLAEQERIVARVQELMAVLDRLEAKSAEAEVLRAKAFLSYSSSLASARGRAEVKTAWSRINKSFEALAKKPEDVKALRATILELAVQGVLAPQDKNDESASELLKRIAVEKARLVKTGKIKAPKELAPITDEEKPYELPRAWAWVRLGDVVDVRDGTHDSPKDAISGKTYPLITSRNFHDGEIDFSSARHISEIDHLEIQKRSKVDSDDILFSMIGGNIGNQVIVQKFTDFSIKNVALFKHFDKTLLKPNYIKRFCEYLALSLQVSAVGGAQPFISLELFRNYPFPLPPLAEQERIVARVTELMKACDRLEAALTAKEESAKGYAQAVCKIV